ncbi:RidA family protein [Rhizobium sp. CNPSo 3490]|uniref:RidA family protein n=1 Tax=Rhizobium sp. CNPSo 3490 TaxID=3021407 RepID=UPI0025501E93|nr:RidA family protein [Rhizobium sp. CNPSo 3490]MDK4737141.1 RidA family protein [Rhizobium sp. CNPSo 3490]
MNPVDRQLAKLGLELPKSNPPQGNYLPFVRAGSLLFIAGQGPRKGGELVFKGTVGDTITLDDAREAARLCALNIVTHVKTACDGDFDKVKRFVRLAGLVRCTAEFEDQAKVLNAASDLICELFGERGPHARIASGTHALPSGMAVEIEAIVELVN